MQSPRTIGRTIGILLLLHLITGLMTPYIMLHWLGASPLTYAANEPANSASVRTAVMLLFVGGAITIAIAVTAWPIFRERSYGLAIWVTSLAIANFSLQCAENAAWMSLFTLSQEYGKAAAADLASYKLIAASVRSYWKWVHYTHLLVMVSWMFIFFATLWRMSLVPRVLAGLGLLTTLMQITGITLPQFLAYPSPYPTAMGLPLAFVYVAVSVWLMIKGFGKLEVSRSGAA